jgi:hypothetical protein
MRLPVRNGKQGTPSLKAPEALTPEGKRISPFLAPSEGSHGLFHGYPQARPR